MTKVLKHIRSTKVTNEGKKDDKKNIGNVIGFQQQIYRVKQDIQRLRNAILYAESIPYPQRYQLYQTYQDAKLDLCLSALMQNRIDMTSSREYNFINPDGTINEEASKLLKTQWFDDFLQLSLESIFDGFSLIQLGNVTDDGFDEVSLVPRIYVKPEFDKVTDSYSSFTGNTFTDDPWKWWTIGVGKKRDLGLLMKLSFSAIWKKACMGAMAEYAEKFGNPYRTIITDETDAKVLADIDKMMTTFGVNNWGRFPKGTEFEISGDNRTDAVKIFTESINTYNTEMTLGVLSQTGSTNEKAHVGSSEVHERVVQKIGKKDTRFIENICNKKLKPILEYHGFAVDGLTIKASDEIDTSKLTNIIELIKTGKFTADVEMLKNEFDVELLPAAEPVEPNTIQKVKNELNGLYP